jgi:membrane fusion protein (multidrug efflux system)
MRTTIERPPHRGAGKGPARPDDSATRPSPADHASPAPAPAVAPVAPAATPPAAAPPVAAPARRRNPLPFVIAGVIALAFAGFGLRQWLYSRHHVRTENAQVEGHVIPVLPKVAGFVAAVGVDENQTVRAGDTLVVIDDRDYRAKLEQAEGDLAVSLAAAGGPGRAGQARAQVQAARANVAQAEAGAWRAKLDLERYRGLAERQVVGRQVLDNAEAAARGADAQLQAAREQVAAAIAGMSGAEAKAEANRAARDQAALQVTYTRIVAPSGGVVSRKNVEVGQLVQVAQPLMTVVPLDDVWIVANLKETEVRDVNPGDPAEIKVDAYPGRRFAGRVESMSPASGARFSLLPPDNATANFTKVVQRIPVRIRLAGPQDPAFTLRPGMSAEVAIRTK